MNKTLSYLKLLERSNKLNDDLDYLSEGLDTRFTNKLSAEPTYDENNNAVFNRHNLLGYNFGSVNNEPNYKETNYKETTSEAIKRHNDEINYLLDINKLCQSQNLFELVQKAAAAQSTPVQRNGLSNLFSQASLGVGDSVSSPPRDATGYMYSQFGKRPYLGQQADFCGTIEDPKRDYSFNSLKGSGYRAGVPIPSSCMSPSSPKSTAKMLSQTPKTPSSLGQYIGGEKSESAWPSANKLTLPSSLNSNSSNRMYMSSVTPPPSATFKTAPLSIITNLESCSKTGSPSFSTPSNMQELLSPSSLNKHGLTRPNDSSMRLNESMNTNPAFGQHDETKHRFFGSPVPRLHASKAQELAGSLAKMQKSLNEFNLFSPYGNNTNYLNQGQFTFNADLATFFPKHESLADESNNNSGGSNFHSPVSNGFKSYLPDWSGRLPPKIYSENAVYSRKVFLGGLPWDVNQQYLVQLLQKYGSVKLEIPGKDAKHPRVSNICKSQERSTPGYVYIIFEHESSVQRMLADCRKEQKNGGEHYYYTIFIPPASHPNNFYLNNGGNKRGKAKEVEVIPWNQEDTSYVPQSKTSILPAKIDAKSTIFVGALHGMLNAQGLAIVMTEVFGEVIHAGLDTDKYKYPIGSGRVTFRNRQSYVKAIRSKFVKIKANLNSSDPSPKFEKTVSSFSFSKRLNISLN